MRYSARWIRALRSCSLSRASSSAIRRWSASTATSAGSGAAGIAVGSAVMLPRIGRWLGGGGAADVASATLEVALAFPGMDDRVVGLLLDPCRGHGSSRRPTTRSSIPGNARATSNVADATSAAPPPPSHRPILGSMTADPTAMPAAPDPADVAVEALHLRIAELEARESEHERSARIQRALYRIAEAATASSALPPFYATIHGIVGELMYAANFYIALYDADRRLLNYPYVVDSIDQTFPDPAVWEPLGDEQGRGITAYALRRGEPVFVDDRSTFEALVAAGEVEQIGPVEPDSQWLGAPLLSQGRILGLIAVQTYTAEHRLDREDLDVLAFVGRHIGAALTRVRASEEIRARNAELTLINEIGAALSSQLDFAGIIELVGERVRSIFDSRTAFVGLYDET